MDAQQEFALPPQEAHQQQLAAMYRQHYRELHPDRLRAALFDYFRWLELAISGNQIAECDERDFTIDELEALNRYQEALLKQLASKNCVPLPLP
jgi:hypothetical protein